MSMIPERHCRSFVASARKANTSAGGRAISTVLVASGTDVAPFEQSLEFVKASLPAHLVRRRAMAGRELAVGEDELGLIAARVELDAHERLRAVGCRPRHPAPGVDKTCGRLDFAVCAFENERISGSGLHHEPVVPAGAQVDLGLGAGELSRTPPAAELLGIGPGTEDVLR